MEEIKFYNPQEKFLLQMEPYGFYLYFVVFYCFFIAHIFDQS